MLNYRELEQLLDGDTTRVTVNVQITEALKGRFVLTIWDEKAFNDLLALYGDRPVTRIAAEDEREFAVDLGLSADMTATPTEPAAPPAASPTASR